MAGLIPILKYYEPKPHEIGECAEMKNPELCNQALQLKGSTSVTIPPNGSWKDAGHRNVMCGKGYNNNDERWIYVELRRKDHSKAWLRNLLWYKDGDIFSNIDGQLQKCN